MDPRPDFLLAGSLMDAAHLKAMPGMGEFPLAVYFHECQASYPSKGAKGAPERDLLYILTDLASAAAADAVIFSSSSLMEEFFGKTSCFLRRMPDMRPLHVLEDIRKKSRVIHQGIDLPSAARPERREGDPLRILWPHRWEHDKNPEEFFRVVEKLFLKGVPMRLLVAGASNSRKPPVFDAMREILGPVVEHWGEVRDREEYSRLVASADVVVSTAHQETFGLAVAEAARLGVHPLVPARLSYPEVVPEELHGRCLYADEEDLSNRLERLLTMADTPVPPEELSEKFARFDWKSRAADFDEMVAGILQIKKRCYTQ